MEAPYEDIQLVTSCSSCGKTQLPTDQELPYKQQQQYQNYQQMYGLNGPVQANTGLSTTNIVIIVILILLLLAGIYLMKRPRGIARRR